MKDIILLLAGMLIAAAIMAQRAEAAVFITPNVPGYKDGYMKGTGHTMTAAKDAYIKTATVNVGGKIITVPAKLRIAANAAQYAKQAMKLNPKILVGTLALDWLLSQNVEYIQGEWKKRLPNTGPTEEIMNSCRGRIFTGPGGTTCEDVARAACPGETQYWSYRFDETGRYSVICYPSFRMSYAQLCYSIGTHLRCTPAKQQYAPMTDKDWNDLPNPLPHVATELPSAPYMQEGVPVDKPVYEFVPFTTPLGQPYERPDGSTVQPMAKVSPNGDRVTVDTYDQPLTDPQGNPIPNSQPQDTPEPQQSQCDMHPQSLGCSTLDVPSSEAITTQQRGPQAINPVSMGGAGACPAPLQVNVLGRTMTMSYDPLCQYASALRPLVLAIAWLSAGTIFIGGVRNA